jgi:hypothetical protein
MGVRSRLAACRRVGVHADLLGRSSAGVRINPNVGLEADAPRRLNLDNNPLAFGAQQT